MELLKPAGNSKIYIVRLQFPCWRKWYSRLEKVLHLSAQGSLRCLYILILLLERAKNWAGKTLGWIHCCMSSHISFRISWLNRANSFICAWHLWDTAHVSYYLICWIRAKDEGEVLCQFSSPISFLFQKERGKRGESDETPNKLMKQYFFQLAGFTSLLLLQGNTSIDIAHHLLGPCCHFYLCILSISH